MSQIVDTETAMEFMQEVMEKVTFEELTAIADCLEIKSQFFQTVLKQEREGKYSEAELHRLLRSVFATRRKTKDILELYPPEKLGPCMHELLYGTAKIETRFQGFCEQLEGIGEKASCDLAGELLHFRFPEQWWLWCRWMWDPKAKTGALPLMVMEDYDLDAPTFGEMYLKVGKAIAFVHHTGEAAGFQKISRSLFGTDVFLSCVYVIYTYTVLRMRMTQEFNKVTPGVNEFSRRILGVNKMEEYA